MNEEIAPSPEAIENFKKAFGDTSTDASYGWLLNKESTVALLTKTSSVEEQKKKMGLGELTYKVKAHFMGRPRANGNRTQKYIKFGENYYAWYYIKRVAETLGRDVWLAQFGKDTPLFIYNDNGICIIAHAMLDEVTDDKVLSLDYICKIESDEKKVDPQDAQVWDVTRLSEEEKEQLIKRLAMELGVRL
jgi:hypothetical protein